MTAPARPDLDDPARRPRTFAQRLQLLLVLLVLPVAAVAVPTVLVTCHFGQRPRPKTSPNPTPAARATPTNPTGLAAALNHSAEQLMPTPAPLTPAPIPIKVRPEHVAARAEKVVRQAQALGGTAVEGVSNPGEKHLFIDLPGGTADTFRRALLDNTLPAPPTATPDPTAARDQLEVIVRPTADDE